MAAIWNVWLYILRQMVLRRTSKSPSSLSSIGARTYLLLRDPFAPDVPGMLPFDRVSEVLTSHFQPRRLVIAERFDFHRSIQAVGESIAEFDAALQNLETYCEFGGTLEEALRDRFVCVYIMKPCNASYSLSMI